MSLQYCCIATSSGNFTCNAQPRSRQIIVQALVLHEAAAFSHRYTSIHFKLDNLIRLVGSTYEPLVYQEN